MTESTDRPGMLVFLSEDAYRGWRAVAAEEGVTTSGLLEMLGRHLEASGSLDLDRALADARRPLASLDAATN